MRNLNRCASRLILAVWAIALVIPLLFNNVAVAQGDPTTATLTGDSGYRDSSDYLLVPDVSPLAADRVA